MSRPVAVLVVVFVLSPAIAFPQAVLGPEFQVNTYITNDQDFPFVATDADGNFAVVWHSRNQDGNLLGVFARFYDPSGAPLGPTDVQVNTFTPNDQAMPRVAASASGEFVVVWTSFGQDGDTGGVFARRFDATGNALGPEFPVNAYTTSLQSGAAVVMDAVGNFVVVWQGDGVGGNAVWARRYNAGGVPAGGEFRVNSYTSPNVGRPSVATDGGGGFIVTWQSFEQDPDGSSGIYAQRYDALGGAAGPEFRVNSHTTGPQSQPSVASDADGRFVAVWSSYGQDLSSYGIFGQRYDAAGTPLGAEFGANASVVNNQTRAQVARDPRGAFTVVWDSFSQDGNNYGIFGRHFDAQGAPDGLDFLVNAHTTASQMRPAIAANERGDFVVAWQSDGQDGAGNGVFARRFRSDLIFRDGFEDGTLDAWSAASTDGGDLDVSGAAALKSTTWGLRGTVDDTAGIYVEDGLPADEDRYRARFYFDPSGFDPGEAQGRFRTRLFIAFSEAPTRRLLAIVLRRQSGLYSLRARVRLDDDTQAETPFLPISAGPHFVEFDLQRSTAPGANDGSFDWAIDGTPGAPLTVDNSRSAVDFVRLGALSVKVGASGTIYWDEFESRRQGATGP